MQTGPRRCAAVGIFRFVGRWFGLARGCAYRCRRTIAMGGIGTHPEDVMHMKRTADRLFGRDYLWSVLATGRKQLPIATMAAGMGGNIRVGLEDNLWIGPGSLPPATQLKCIAPARLSKVWDWKSQHQPMHVRSCRSRAAIRSPSRTEAHFGSCTGKGVSRYLCPFL
jgi:hypothetical protein